MPLLSLIMPARNAEAFIGQAIESVQALSLRDWELIIVDDGSTDGTAVIAGTAAAADPRIAVLTNPGQGQVQAINRGFGRSRGDHVKIMDADDLLPPSFAEAFGRLKGHEASYHDAWLLDEATGRRTRLLVGRRFERLRFDRALRRIMVSPPRWSWTLSRPVADRVFPLPAGLPTPHEDVFFGLMIKKAAAVRYVPEPLYVYRQHPGQFYGGLFNFSPETVRRRAEAMLGIIEAVERSPLVEGLADAARLLAPARSYYGLMSLERTRWGDILRSDLSLYGKARLALVRKAPALASRLSRLRALRPAPIDSRTERP